MFKTRQLLRLTSVFSFALALTSIGYAQTETRCDPNANDCPNSEKEDVKKDTGSQEVVFNTEKLKAVKFVPDSGGFAVRTPTKDPIFGLKKTSTVGVSTQQTPEQDPQALAKKLSNPVASLISLPFQNTFDFGMGPNEDGFKYTLNIQPVIPIKINKDWNLISRTIVPIIGQTNVVGTSSQFGLGDTVQSFFFSPNKTEPFIWGLGPQILIPTATNEFLGTQKLGLGLTGLILKQKGQWTVGALVGHVWSVAGKESRADVSSTNIQPFISYTTKTAWTFNVNTESTYNWEGKTWSVPVHFTVTKLVRLGKQPVSVGGALRCWANSGPGGPQWCGFRFLFTPLFPKR